MNFSKKEISFNESDKLNIHRNFLSAEDRGITWRGLALQIGKWLCFAFAAAAAALGLFHLFLCNNYALPPTIPRLG